MEGQVRDEVIRSEETNSVITTSLCYFFHQLLKSLFKCLGYDQHHNHNREESEEEEIIINGVENTNASSSAPISLKHDVFLSFRGEDTRAKFTSHLEKKLSDMKIETFIDNRLEKGDNISDALIEAIRSSKMSVIVFSVNYATSSWCLDEVLYIVECMEKQGQVVIPVFYEVDPSHVRKQTESYEAAFAKLKERFKDNKVNKWRFALTQLADLSGFPSQQYKTDSELVEAIAKDILLKLNGMSTSGDFKDLIGIEKSVEEVENLLCIDSSGVRIIGIWGMGGLGKTTLTRVLFERLSSNFEACCFLQNVNAKSKQLEGLEELKKKLFSELLGEKDLNRITNSHKDRLGRKKVLVVLDDVDQLEQLDELAGDQSWFGDGSRVIVTTRDYHALGNRRYEKYELKALNKECALELFIMVAFRTNSPTSHDIGMSKRVVDYANGIPLALKVLGSFLHSRSRENWEIEIDRFKKVPNKTVQNALQISYDGLSEDEQRVFLDIVCFVDVGQSICKYYVERILGGDRSLKIDIESLVKKSLIIDEHNYLRMHDLVREMGWEVVRQECRKIPGKRSRLFDSRDCYYVLKHNAGRETIEGISDGYQIKEPGRIWTKHDCDRIFKHKTGSFKGQSPITIDGLWIGSRNEEVELSPTAFDKMYSLRFLQIVDWNVRPTQEIEFLPRELNYLEWYCWPFKSMPKNYSPRYLVELRMRKSNLERLWSGQQKLENLKHVDLSHSYSLTDVSSLSEAPNLESVDLSECRRLHQVPSLRFGGLKNSYHKCDDNKCSTLGHLNLQGSNVKVISSPSGGVKKLDLSESLIEELPLTSIEYLSSIEELRLSFSKRLKNFSTSICMMRSLKRLLLNHCAISEIPNDISFLSLLEELDLSGNPIGQIPLGVQQLCKLKKLQIVECENLKFLPELPLLLELVDARGCIGLHTVRSSRDVIQQEPWSDYHVTRSRRFIFLRCPLDQYTSLKVVEGFILRVLRTAAAIVLNDVNVNKEFGHPDIGICFSGNKIPRWFSYQSHDVGICLNLPSRWHNANFLGFSVAVVIEKDPFVEMFIDFSCNLSFVMNNQEFRRFEWSFRDNYSLVYDDRGSNMFMWYRYENYHHCCDAEEVTLRFSMESLPGFRVTACGLRPLYLQDYEKVFEKTGEANNKIVFLP